MSTASASRTIKFISRVGAINTRIQCNMGDLFQRYTGTASAPTAHIPDFASMAVKPMLEFQCFTSRLNAQGESIADVSAFKVSINGQEIVFDGTTKKSIGVKNADFSIITSDNPRTEAPMAIIADILKGITPEMGEYTVIEDRRKAIRYAMDIGKKDDIIVLAGKGHETYQEIDGHKYHLDEREEVQSYLSELRKLHE